MCTASQCGCLLGGHPGLTAAQPASVLCLFPTAFQLVLSYRILNIAHTFSLGMHPS